MFTDIVLLDYRRPLAQRRAARKHVGPYHWRPSQPMTGRGFYQDSKALQMDRMGSSIDLRLEPANDHLGHSRTAQTNGYYCDTYGEETLKPIIARLPSGRGFLAGWTMGEGMCATLAPERYADVTDAAYAAHSLAETDAEKEREFQEAENARLDAEEA